MAGGFKIYNQKEMHFVTFQIVDWIDLFTRQLYRDELITNFRFYHNTQGLRVHAYVIMSIYIHAILSATQPKIDLSCAIGRFKSYTSKRLVNLRHYLLTIEK